MKSLIIAALIGAQLAAVAPAWAADLNDPVEHDIGAFGGVRVRLPFDGNVRDRQVRAGLTIAPTMRTTSAAGESRLRIGEGVELGFRGGEPVRLAIAGQDVRRLAARQGGEDEDGGGIPTGAWIAGGIVLTAIAGVVFLAIAFDNANDND